MPFQSAIIAIINNALTATALCDPRFANASVNGIAYDGTETDTNGLKTYPVVFDLTGNGTRVNPDDTYPLQIYHRILAKAYQVRPTSVGDRSNVVAEKTDVRMVVAGWTNRLNLTQEDLEALITSSFPDQISASLYTPLKLQNLVVTLQSAVMDRAQVFREEYRGIPWQVKPEQILFAIRYQIESTWQKGCFIISDCPACAPGGII